MAAAGILARVLPGADPACWCRSSISKPAGAPRWQRRLAALGWNPDWAEALRLSSADARALEATAAALAADEPPAAAAYRHGADAARDAALIRAASLGEPAPPGLEAEVARGAAAVFPLRAADLDLTGPPLGRDAPPARGSLDRLRLHARRHRAPAPARAGARLTR